MSISAFAYAQARLQARHGLRPDEQLWHRLQGVGELGHYLQIARSSVLERWVGGMRAEQSSHDIELSLRTQLREYIDEVAVWVPRAWRAPMAWTKRLHDLTAIRHLLTEQELPAWLSRDAALAPFTAGTIAERRRAMAGSDCSCLVQSWDPAVPVYQTWLQCWQQLWPKAPRLAVGLRRLGAIRELQASVTLAGVSDVRGEQRAALVGVYERAFRRYSFQPGAAFAHLALVALDLQRLRSGILRRRLFAETAEAG
ncbi:MAG: hypothetical protein PVI91_02160 [Gammaproteobacteria bacterium]|jgi:hypothetical protein